MKTLRHLLWILGSYWVLTPVASYGQLAYWVLPPDPVQAGVSFEIELVFEECIPQAAPQPPKVAGLSLRKLHVRSSSQFARSHQFPKTRFLFSALARDPGTYQIPPFEVPTDQGPVLVPKLAVWVAPPEANLSSFPSDTEPVRSVLIVPTTSVWVGEPFPIEYELVGKQGTIFEPAGPPEWSPEDLVIEGWKKAGVLYWQEEGKRAFRYQTNALATQPGKLQLPSVFQEVRVEIEARAGSGYFAPPSYQSLSTSSNTLTLEVKPLPPAPKGFSRAVGQFRLVSRIEPSEVRVGEPVSWTLEVAGVGNWPERWGLPPRTVPAGMRVVEPRPRRQLAGSSLFQGSLLEEVVLIPSQPGNYQLAPVVFTYFDPVQGSFQTLRTEPIFLRVLPSPMTQAGPNGIFFGPWKGTQSQGPIVGIATPPNLLRPELEGESLGWAPFPFVWTLLPGALVAGTLCVAWIFFACREARKTDPLWARHWEARSLEKLLEEPQILLENEKRQWVRQWTRKVAFLLGLSKAEPSFQDWKEALERHGIRGQAQETWLQLLSETERFLYSQEGTLPPDWPVRAREALQKAPWSQRPSVLLLGSRLRLRYFFPLLWLFVGMPWEAVWPEPLWELRQGNFSSAIQGWTSALSERPTDWKLRNNLGLALSQVGRWPEAMAHFASAVLLAPRKDEPRWNLKLALQKVGVADPRIVQLSQPWRFPFIASFAEWELLWTGAFTLLSLSFFPWMLGRYRLCPWTPCKRLASLGAGTALALGLVSLSALVAYGPLGDPNVALFVKDTRLRTLPTDAVEETRLVVAGNLGIGQKEFLGWQQVRLINREVGWTRKDALVFLYTFPRP